MRVRPFAKRERKNTMSKLYDAILGLAIGDALGVPYEFEQRGSFICSNMVGYGTHNQPEGTWSDDTSMTLATLDSLKNNNGIIVTEDICRRFNYWLLYGDYTVNGEVFDAGITTCTALKKGRPAVGEWDNGNGSLMRIMPVSLYDALEEEYWNDTFIEEAAENAHNVSSLTHGHPRSQIACFMHTSICHELIYRGDEPVYMALWKGIHGTFDFYERRAGALPWFDDAFKRELSTDAYGRLRDLEAFMNLPDSEIKGSGYVVDTL